jgi:uncharacterized membrane protein
MSTNFNDATTLLRTELADSDAAPDAAARTADKGAIGIAAVRASVRLQSIDILRGLVIMLMALDHVRDYFTNTRFIALDATQITVPIFFTRWITHFCAPTFIFLAGVSAYLVSLRCSRSELRRFLLTRGLWLIFLEVTVVSFAWGFGSMYSVGIVLQVIWAIGASMVLMAALVNLPIGVLATIGVVMIAGHNLLDGFMPTPGTAGAAIWTFLHLQAPIAPFFVVYPLIPWVGVMALGYVAGQLFEMESAQRRRILLIAGCSALVTFVLLRFTNVYGDPQRWVHSPDLVRSLLSFLNVEKYPPSLLYLLVTLGAAALLLAKFENVQGKWAEVLQTFGRVPLFFYVLHILLAHGAAGLIAMAMGYGTRVLNAIFLTLPPDWGFDLPVIYLGWILVLVTLYPACRWFAGVKQRRRDWWLAYL